MAEEMEPWAGQTCFIIGPIGSSLDPRGTAGRSRYEESLQMWEKVFEPACESLGLRPIRADKIADPGEIPEQIFLYLRDSAVVIADVTEGNPNVMYELGLRHTRDLVTVQIGEYARLPFDIGTIRTLQFKRTEGGLVEIRDALIEGLRAGLKGSGKPVTATRVWNELSVVDPATISAAIAASSEPDDAGESEEPGFMDVLADGEAAIGELTEVLERSSVLMQETGGLASDAQGKIQESDTRGRGFVGRLMVAKELASDLRSPAEALESAANEFNAGIAKVDAMIHYIIARAAEDSAEAGEAEVFVRGVLGMIDASEESEKGVRAMLSGAISLPKIARDLAPVSKVLERALNQFLKGIGAISDWRGPLVELLDDGEVREAE